MISDINNKNETAKDLSICGSVNGATNYSLVRRYTVPPIANSKIAMLTILASWSAWCLVALTPIQYFVGVQYDNSII